MCAKVDSIGRRNGWGASGVVACDLVCAEACGGGRRSGGRRGGWGTGDVATCDLVCTEACGGGWHNDWGTGGLSLQKQ